MKKVVIINGSGTVGKNEFCEMCNTFIPCMVVSTVDKVKKAYELLGWDGDKSEKHRKGLSDIKDIATANLDHPYTYISDKINEFLDNDFYEVMFIHSREPDEIQRFVDAFGCITLLIKNINVKHIISNHADADVEKYDYDYVIENYDTLDSLYDKAEKFVNELRKGI